MFAAEPEKQLPDAGAAARTIRLTIVSSNLQNLLKACDAITAQLRRAHLHRSGPVPMPRRRLRVTTRRAPCGNGTETYDHFELRIYKRLISFVAPVSVIREVTRVAFDPGVHIEVSVIPR
jgi:small subunit ribosomal protein S20e